MYWTEHAVTTYLSPSSPGLAWVSNNLFHLFSSDSWTEIAPLTAEIAVESFFWSDAGGLPAPSSQCSVGKRRGKSRGNIRVYVVGDFQNPGEAGTSMRSNADSSDLWGNVGDGRK